MGSDPPFRTSTIDHNGLGALRGQRPIHTQQKLTHVLGCLAAVTTEID